MNVRGLSVALLVLCLLTCGTVTQGFAEVPNVERNRPDKARALKQVRRVGAANFDSREGTAESLGIPRAFVDKLIETKEQLNDAQLEELEAQFGILPNGNITFQIGPDEFFVLISTADLERQPSDASVEASRGDLSGREGDAPLPTSNDHRPQQTPIRNQGQRNTCVAHASLAEIEAKLIRDQQADPATTDLNENLAYLFYMREENSDPCSDPGLATFRAAKYLQEHTICGEEFWPYVATSPTVLSSENQCNSIGSAPDVVVGKPGRGISTYLLLPKGEEVDPDGSLDISDTDTLERLLADGHDIVFGAGVTWKTADANGIIDVKRGNAGQPIAPRGGHAMMIVGYDRTGPTPFFWAKNSWGEEYGHNGYLKFSYDYIRTYARYGYTTRTLREGAVSGL